LPREEWILGGLDETGATVWARRATAEDGTYGRDGMCGRHGARARVGTTEAPRFGALSRGG
jgi:hypothetical protein